MSIHQPDSPCQGYCTTYHGDTVCKACLRTEEEIFNWIMYTDEEEKAVWDRLEMLKEEAMKKKNNLCF